MAIEDYITETLEEFKANEHADSLTYAAKILAIVDLLRGYERTAIREHELQYHQMRRWTFPPLIMESAVLTWLLRGVPAIIQTAQRVNRDWWLLVLFGASVTIIWLARRGMEWFSKIYELVLRPLLWRRAPEDEEKWAEESAAA